LPIGKPGDDFGMAMLAEYAVVALGTSNSLGGNLGHLAQLMGDRDE
jgi:hypothetical protein